MRDELALAQILAADLGEPIPGHDRVVLGMLRAAAIVVRGDAELGDGLAARELAHLRVARKATRQQNLVHPNTS